MTFTTQKTKKGRSKLQSRPMTDRFRKMDSYAKTQKKGGKRKYRGVTKAKRAANYYGKGREGLFVRPTRVTKRLRGYMPESIKSLAEITRQESDELPSKFFLSSAYTSYVALAIDAAFKDIVQKACACAKLYRGKKDGGLTLKGKDVDIALSLS